MKPDKARSVENLVLQMAQRGQITEKVGIVSCPLGWTCSCIGQALAVRKAVNAGLVLLLQVSEQKLISLLEQINTQASSRSQTKVTIQRRRTAWDDEED